MNFQKLMQTRDSMGLLVLRVVTGIIFIAHGLPKFGWMGGKGLAATAERWQSNPWIPVPEISAFVVASVETFGGALPMGVTFICCICLPDARGRGQSFAGQKAQLGMHVRG